MNYVPPRRSDGTLQTRRQPLPWPQGRSFRILSIDGGGICGILPASLLAEIETRFLGGRSVVDYFDLIAGTSTGGIIALGLAHGLTAYEIKDFYIERGHQIFPHANFFERQWRRLRRLLRHVYASAPLERELLKIFGDTPLEQARTRLCIASFEGVHGEPWIFKTPHHPDYKKDRFERMVKIALATSAAPTYLRAVPNAGYVMVDGGLWANNPIMNGLVDVLACFDVARDNIRILSLGCGETSFKVDASRSSGGLWQWKDGLRAAMRAQSLNALGQAYLTIGKENIVRLDAPESSDPIPMDDHRRAVDSLPDMARSLVEGAGHRIRDMFLEGAAIPYTPCPL